MTLVGLRAAAHLKTIKALKKDGKGTEARTIVRIVNPHRH